MRKILFILPIIFLFACKKEATGPIGPTGGPVGIGGGPPGTASISVFYKNIAGENLLNPLTPNSIDPYQILASAYNEAGQKVSSINPQINYLGSFQIKQSSSFGTYMHLYLNGLKTTNKITTYLKYIDGSEDKITLEVYDYIHFKNLWVNDILKATDSDRNFYGNIEIVK